MYDSVRVTILKAIKAAFEAVEPPPTPPGPVGLADWPIKFSLVELGPLTGGDHKKRYSIGIVPQGEKETHAYPYVLCDMIVGIEYRVTINKGDKDPALMAEDVLTVVKRVILQDKTWGGIATDTNLTGNEIDIGSYDDKTAMGVQYVEIKYRHNHLDPRNPTPNA